MKRFFCAVPLAVLLVGFLLWGMASHSVYALLTPLAIIIHEAGHLIGAALVGVSLGDLRITTSEARLTPNGGLLPYGKELWICLCGPLSNAVCAFVASLFGARLLDTSPLSFFATVSISLAILNMLPVFDFDGGRILSCIFALVLDLKTATALCRILSFLTLFSLWCISVYALLRVGENLSLFLFSATLFLRLFAPFSH